MQAKGIHQGHARYIVIRVIILLSKPGSLNLSTDILRHMEIEINQVKLPRLKHERTALPRKTITAPLREAMNHVDLDGFIGLEMGSGKSVDAKFIERAGGYCFKYDPFYEPLSAFELPDSFDFILLIYVLNVLPPAERKIVVDHAKILLKKSGFIVLAVREDRDSIRDWQSFEDGWITSHDTFQTFFAKDDSRIHDLFKDMIRKRIGRGTWILTID